MKMMKLLGAAAALFVGAGAAMAAEADEPVFHLTFDECKEGIEVCVDRMKPERVCKLHNPRRISFVDGKIGKAIFLDNPNTKLGPKDNPMAGVDVPDFWDPVFAKALSIEAWVKIAKDTEFRTMLMYIVQCGYQYGFGFSLYYNGQNFMFLTGPTGKAADTLVVASRVADLRDEWTHIAATYDGEKKLAKLYINGECVKEKEDFVITPPKNRHQPLFIGYTSNQRGWRGAIDELKIYKRVLTPAEILQHAKLEL